MTGAIIAYIICSIVGTAIFFLIGRWVLGVDKINKWNDSNFKWNELHYKELQKINDKLDKMTKQKEE